MKKKDRKMLEELSIKVTTTSEVQFLKYLIDCCENVLEDGRVMAGVQIMNPMPMQLIKLRAEITHRLEQVYGIRYGRFANRTHLLAQG